MPEPQISLREYLDAKIMHERELVDAKFEARDKALLLQSAERESRLTMRIALVGLAVAGLTIALKVLWK